MKFICMIITLSFLIFCYLLLPGCEQRHHAQIAANKFMDNIIAVEKNKIPAGKVTIETNVLIPYVVAHLRDPFEIPIIASDNKKYPDTILNDVALDTVKLIGVIVHHKQSWAVIRTNKGQLYGLTIGTRVGLQNALLTQVEENQVKFIQEVNTLSGMENQEIVLRLQTRAPEGTREK